MLLALFAGGNSGIGLETARVLAKAGSIVLIACRSMKNGSEAVATLKAENPRANVTAMELDLTSFSSIRQFAAAYKATKNPLHLLFNNAGVMACPKTITSEGLELQFATNHIGHFLLVKELMEVIKASGTVDEPARIVNLSSMVCTMAPDYGIPFDDLHAKKSYDKMERYSVSKFANVLFTKQLQRNFELERANVIAVSLHPGVIETNLARHLTSTWWDNVSFRIMWFFISILINEPTKTIPQGAATSVYCALAPEVLQHGGEYFFNCKLETKNVHMHKLHNDVKLAEDLWKISEEIVNK